MLFSLSFVISLFFAPTAGEGLQITALMAVIGPSTRIRNTYTCWLAFGGSIISRCAATAIRTPERSNHARTAFFDKKVDVYHTHF